MKKQFTATYRLLFALAALFLAVASFVSTPKSVDAAFPGTNGRIVFAQEDSSLDYRLFTVKPDGTGLVNLNQMGNDPMYSPDGTKIVFLQDGNIKRINRDGSGLTTLYSPAAGDAVIDMTWSPDGTKIAFEYVVDFGEVTQDSNLVTINSDGTGLANVTGAATAEYAEKDPHWNPVGQSITFYRAPVDGGDSQIYTVNLDTDAVTQLAAETGVDLEHPQYSPDGDTIVYVRVATRDQDGLPTDADIYTMTNAGASKTARTSGSNVDWDPSYSPDGTKIIFHRGVPGGFSTQSLGQLYAMSSTGTNITDLNVDNVEEPDWGRAAELVYNPSCTTEVGNKCTVFEPEVPTVCRVADLTDADSSFGKTVTDGGFGYLPNDTTAGGQQFTYVTSDPDTLDVVTCNFTVTFIPKSPNAGTALKNISPWYILGTLGLSGAFIATKRRYVKK